MSILISLQEKVASVYNSLDSLENKYTYRLNKFGTSDELAILFLSQMQDSKLELLVRQRTLEMFKANEDGVSLLEAPAEALQANATIDSINALVATGKLSNDLISVIRYIEDVLFFSNSQVKGLLVSYYKNNYLVQ